MKSMKNALLGVKIVIACAFVQGGTAHAVPAGGPPNFGVRDGRSSEFSLEVVGRVQDRCGFAPNSEPQSQQTFDANGAVIAPLRIPFRLACNDQFTFRVTSEHGSLKLLGSEGATQGYAAKAGFSVSSPYRVSVAIPRSDGTTISEDCASEQVVDGTGCAMASSAGLESDVPPGGGDASLTISFPEAVSPLDHVAGRYRDTLTITVAAR